MYLEQNQETNPFNPKQGQPKPWISGQVQIRLQGQSANAYDIPKSPFPDDFPLAYTKNIERPQYLITVG